MLFRVMVRAHLCSIDGRVLLGAFFGGVLLEVLVCKHCYLGSMLVYFVHLIIIVGARDFVGQVGSRSFRVWTTPTFVPRL